MNRAELVDKALYFDALAAAAAAKAAEARAELAAQARAEHAEQGAAPTWRTLSGTVSLAITQPAYAVDDPQVFADYVAGRAPSEVQELRQVRPAYSSQLLKALAKRGDVPVDSDGVIVPGLRYLEGGQPKGVSILSSTETKAGFAELAAAALDRLMGGAE